MYDAQQGSTSGAHIDMSTGTGTDNIHGRAYVPRGTNWLNADRYFYNADPNISLSEKNPSLHRYSAGVTIGLPIKKDKISDRDEVEVHGALEPRGRRSDRHSIGGWRSPLRPVG